MLEKSREEAIKRGTACPKCGRSGFGWLLVGTCDFCKKED